MSTCLLLWPFRSKNCRSSEYTIPAPSQGFCTASGYDHPRRHLQASAMEAPAKQSHGVVGCFGSCFCWHCGVTVLGSCLRHVKSSVSILGPPGRHIARCTALSLALLFENPFSCACTRKTQDCSKIYCVASVYPELCWAGRGPVREPHCRWQRMHCHRQAAKVRPCGGHAAVMRVAVVSFLHPRGL